MLNSEDKSHSNNCIDHVQQEVKNLYKYYPAQT